MSLEDDEKMVDEAIQIARSMKDKSYEEVIGFLMLHYENMDLVSAKAAAMCAGRFESKKGTKGTL